MPIYLQSAVKNFAQLKRVIAVTGDKVVEGPALDEAMANLFVAQKPLAVFSKTPDGLKAGRAAARPHE